MTDQMEMPKYKCHKVVHALEISSIKHHSDGTATITPKEEGYAPFLVNADYVKRHEPKTGGYFVVYEDGYRSWAPKKTFESGYTRI